MCDGFGICVYKNRDKYEGQWKMCNKEGYGLMKYSNGDRYHGEWDK